MPIKAALAESHMRGRHRYDLAGCNRAETAVGVDTDMDGMIASGDIASNEDLDPRSVEACRKWCSEKTTMNDTFPRLEEPPTVSTDAEENSRLEEIGVCLVVEYNKDCGV